jgi:hypothetical protein
MLAGVLLMVMVAMAMYLVSGRVSTNSQLANREEISMTFNKNNGIIDKPSNHSAD